MVNARKLCLGPLDLQKDDGSGENEMEKKGKLRKWSRLEKEVRYGSSKEEKLSL